MAIQSCFRKQGHHSGQSSLRTCLLPGLVAFWVFSAAINSQSKGAETTAKSERPNILFVFADDQCFSTIAALGNHEVQTPNLDKLVRQGTTFTHCFNMGSWSGAVCVASRTMLNSGRYLWNAEAIYKTSEKERIEGRWWSEMMRNAGYRTYMTGKWHCQASAQKGFDRVADVRGGMPAQTPAGYGRPLPDGTDPWSSSDPKFGGFWEGGKHWSEVVADHTVEFLSEARDNENPFFMYVAFNAPHDPRQAPKEYLDLYPVDQVEVPENFLPTYPFAEAIGCGPGLRDEALAPFPRFPRAVQVHRREYYALITHMDAQIGRILDALEASGKAESTWIIFTADHGLAVGQHGLMGKQNLYDHSVRVPMIVVGPGVQADARIASPIYLQDAMPTTLELAGIERPEFVEFDSFLPAFSEQASQWSEGVAAKPIYGAYLNLQRSIRTDRFKLIVYPKAQRVRLYDLQNDPLEQRDLADMEEYRETLTQLFSQLRTLQTDMQDSLDLSAIQTKVR